MIEFSQLKAAWRQWLDQHLDHSLMLCQDDPMVEAVQAVEPQSRLFLTSQDPTTETLAQLLWQQATQVLENLGYAEWVEVERVRLEETQVNAAEYLP